MMKSFCMAVITLMTMTTASAMNFTPMKPMAGVSGDTEIFKFIQGDWKLVDGSCLSGTPVYWGGNFNDFKFIMHFNSDLSYSDESYHSGTLVAGSKGSFAVTQGLLAFHQDEVCNYDPNQQVCYTGSNTNWSSMVSLQGSQLWLLMSMGGDPGSCPAHDVLTFKFDRK